jgi:hypothetical protein
MGVECCVVYFVKLYAVGDYWLAEPLILVLDYVNCIEQQLFGQT